MAWSSTEEMCTIEPRDYQNFIFRGEGQANYVIGATHKASATRYVWRIGKIHKTHFISTKPNSVGIHEYMNTIIKPLFDQKYLLDYKLVRFKTFDIHLLGKIAKLPHNQVVEDFELFAALPLNSSALRLSNFIRVEDNNPTAEPEYLFALQMLDVTQLPVSVLSEKVVNPTFTLSKYELRKRLLEVEIKPKQGFFQHHEGLDVKLCQTCFLMLDKLYNLKKYSSLCHYCPLKMYSGNYQSMFETISALFKEPHGFFKLFLNGTVIHSGDEKIENMEKLLFPNQNAQKDDIIQALCLLLTGSTSMENFTVQPGSVLDQIRSGQMIDDIGVIEAHGIYQKLDQLEKESLMDKTMFNKIGLAKVLEPVQSELHKLHKYFLAATIKDCSIMVTFRLRETLPPNSSENFIQLPNGIVFQYMMKIVDLDPKIATNLTSGYERYLSGTRMLKDHYEEIMKAGYHVACEVENVQKKLEEYDPED